METAFNTWYYKPGQAALRQLTSMSLPQIFICRSPPPEPWFATVYSMANKVVAVPFNPTL